MSDEIKPQPTPPLSFGQRLGNALIAFLHSLVKLILIAAGVVLVGAALFIGFPLFYTHYVIPLQENTDQLNALETEKDQMSLQLTDSAATQSSLFSVLQSQGTQAAGALQDLQTRMGDLEKSLPTRLDADEKSLTAILDRLKAAETDLTQVDSSLKGLPGAVVAQSTALAGLQQTQMAQATAQDIPAEALRRELQLVKAMEMLTRARLFLVQNNLGLAQGDIQSARDLMVGLRSLASPSQTAAVDAITARLDLALGDLKDAPALAPDDLEVAWQLLLRGLPQEAPLGPASFTDLTPSPTLTTTLTLTPTVVLTLTVTPTAGTLTQTLTPTLTLTPTPKP